MEGIAAFLGSENGSRYRGVSQLQSHQSRYTVQLSLGMALPKGGGGTYEFTEIESARDIDNLGNSATPDPGLPPLC